MARRFTYQEYWDALDSAGPRMKERVLRDAADNPDISLRQMTQLVNKAYPDFP